MEATSRLKHEREWIDRIRTELCRNAGQANWDIARALVDEISDEKPLLDSRLPDGSRVLAIVGQL
jgi:hypothetical protein